MGAPWEQYQQTAVSGPWSQYKPSIEPPAPSRDLVSQIPTEPGANLTPTRQAPISILDKIRGAIEVAPAMASGLVSGVVAPIAGIGATLTSGKYGTQEGIRVGEETAKRVQKEFYQPRTEQGQEYTQAVGETLAPLVGVPIPTLNQLGKSAPAAIRAVSDAVRSEANLVGGAIAAPLEARAARIQESRVAESYQNASKIDAATAARNLDLGLNPAVSNPTLPNKIRSALAENINVNRELNNNNIAKLPNIIKNDLGLPPETTLNSKGYTLSREQVSGPYNEVRKLPALTADEAILAKLDALRSEALIGGESAAKVVGNLIDDAIQKIDAGLTGNLAVKNIQQLRNEAQTIRNAGRKGAAITPEQTATADAKMGIANAIESLIEGNIQDPKFLGRFRDARVKMATSYAYENATDFNTGKIDPQAIAKITASDNALTGTIADIGKIAGNFPDVMNLGAAQTVSGRRHLVRSSVSGTIGLAAGLPFGQPIAGALVGAAIGEAATALGAKRIASLANQQKQALPPDYRPKQGLLSPADINYGPNQVVPYRPEVVGPSTGGQANKLRIIGYNENGRPIYKAEESRQGFTTPQQPPEFGPTVFESQRGLPNEVPKQIYEAQKNAELAQEFRAAAERQPTGRGSVLEFDPITQTYKVGGAGVKGATPEIFMADTGQSLNIASEKVAAGKLFDLTAAEKVAWDKTKVNLANAVPELRLLTDKAIASKMMDRQWIDSTIQKIKDKAQAYDDIANRSANAAAKREASIARDKLYDELTDLETALTPARPVSGTGQGPKTRQFNLEQTLRNQ